MWETVFSVISEPLGDSHINIFSLIFASNDVILGIILIGNKNFFGNFSLIYQAQFS